MDLKYINRLAGAVRRFLTARGDGATTGRAAATALAVRLASAALAYLAQVVLARFMGQHEYGVFAYIWVWFMIGAAVSSLGLSDASLRLIPEMRQRGETDHLRGFLLFGPAMSVLSAATAAAAVVAILVFGPPWLASDTALPLMVMVFAVPVVCAQAFLEGIGRSYGWVLPALLPTYVFRHGFLLLVMVAAVGLGFEANAVTGFASLVIGVLLSLCWQAWAIIRRLRRVLEPGPRAYRPREWMGAGLPFAVLYGCSYLFSFADVMALSFFVSPAEIAVYFAATRIIQIVNLLPFAATVSTAHQFADANTRGATGEMQRLADQVGLLTFALAIACALAIGIAGQWLLAMFGSGYEAGYGSLLILAVGIAARVAAGPAEDILNMTGNGAVSASTYAVAVVISLGLNAALIVPFGIEGAAVATSLVLVGRAVWLARSVRRHVGVRTAVWRPMLALLARRKARRPAVEPHPAE